LSAVEQETGVPAAIIVAIIGVETQYGQHTGNFRVIDALSTLAFAYPPRSKFFRSELEHFLLLCRDEQIDPLTPTGSYAGAMGMPQFMPSSYRSYSVDFDKDKCRDIWHNSKDVIASIANYFAKHGWQTGQPIAFQIRDADHSSAHTTPFLKENLRNLKSNSVNPNISKPLLSTNKAKIIAFEQENGEELWAPSENFYVVMRYNHSPLYAMAVFQLSLAISNQRVPSSYEKNHNPATRFGAM
jgi:membrane-bound lytic murein transglycosylase B